MPTSPSVWSMTGYGQGQSSLGPLTVGVQLRTVNHRHADVRVKASPELADHTAWLEERVRSRLLRGRAEVHAHLEGESGQGVTLQVERARSAYQQLRTLRDELGADEAVPLSLLVAVPGLFSTRDTSLDETEARSALGRALDQAFDALDAMRAREGAALVQDLRARLDLLTEHSQWIEDRRPDIVAAARTRLRSRLASLLDDSKVPLNEGRLEHEIAVFADRSDVAEEITRLRSHVVQFREQLTQAGAPAGRKLDFLVQEMGREVNTIGSKANDAPLAHCVVELKAELERIREQVQNIL